MNNQRNPYYKTNEDKYMGTDREGWYIGERNRAIKMGRANKKYNTYNLSGEYGLGYPTNAPDAPFMFDLEDHDKIKDYCWHLHYPSKDSPEYAAVIAYDPNTGRFVKIWWLIMGEKYIDHINRNTLDNRKQNLRKCTTHQNSMNLKKKSNNTSGVSGVGTIPNSSKWRARVMFNRKEINLGYYEDFDDAVRARLIGEYKYFGEFAPQKHLWEQYGLTEEEVKNAENS